MRGKYETLHVICPFSGQPFPCRLPLGTVQAAGILYITTWAVGTNYHCPQGEKRQLYDEDIRVPLIVRGPGIKLNSTTQALALSIYMVYICHGTTIGIPIYRHYCAYDTPHSPVANLHRHDAGIVQKSQFGLCCPHLYA